MYNKQQRDNILTHSILILLFLPLSFNTFAFEQRKKRPHIIIWDTGNVVEGSHEEETSQKISEDKSTNINIADPNKTQTSSLSSSIKSNQLLFDTSKIFIPTESDSSGSSSSNSSTTDDIEIFATWPSIGIDIFIPDLGGPPKITIPDDTKPISCKTQNYHIISDWDDFGISPGRYLPGNPGEHESVASPLLSRGVFYNVFHHPNDLSLSGSAFVDFTPFEATSPTGNDIMLGAMSISTDFSSAIFLDRAVKEMRIDIPEPGQCSGGSLMNYFNINGSISHAFHFDSAIGRYLFYSTPGSYDVLEPSESINIGGVDLRFDYENNYFHLDGIINSIELWGAQCSTSNWCYKLEEEQTTETNNSCGEKGYSVESIWDDTFDESYFTGEEFESGGVTYHVSSESAIGGEVSITDELTYGPMDDLWLQGTIRVEADLTSDILHEESDLSGVSRALIDFTEEPSCYNGGILSVNDEKLMFDNLEDLEDVDYLAGIAFYYSVHDGILELQGTAENLIEQLSLSTHPNGSDCKTSHWCYDPYTFDFNPIDDFDFGLPGTGSQGTVAPGDDGGNGNQMIESLMCPADLINWESLGVGVQYDTKQGTINKPDSFLDSGYKFKVHSFLHPNGLTTIDMPDVSYRPISKSLHQNENFIEPNLIKNPQGYNGAYFDIGGVEEIRIKINGQTIYSPNLQGLEAALNAHPDIDSDVEIFMGSQEGLVKIWNTQGQPKITQLAIGREHGVIGDLCLIPDLIDEEITTNEDGVCEDMPLHYQHINNLDLYDLDPSTALPEGGSIQNINHQTRTFSYQNGSTTSGGIVTIEPATPNSPEGLYPNNINIELDVKDQETSCLSLDYIDQGGNVNLGLDTSTSFYNGKKPSGINSGGNSNIFVDVDISNQNFETGTIYFYDQASTLKTILFGGQETVFNNLECCDAEELLELINGEEETKVCEEGSIYVGQTIEGKIACCGNGAVEKINPNNPQHHEQCDDGNTEPGDGCSASCMCEYGLNIKTGECKQEPEGCSSEICPDHENLVLGTEYGVGEQFIEDSGIEYTVLDQTVNLPERGFARIAPDPLDFSNAVKLEHLKLQATFKGGANFTVFDCHDNQVRLELHDLFISQDDFTAVDTVTGDGTQITIIPEGSFKFQGDECKVSTIEICHPSPEYKIDLIFGGNEMYLDCHEDDESGNEGSGHGDVNNDGFVNVTDIILVINVILGVSNDKDFEKLKKHDINKDDKTDVLDIIKLVNIILEAK